MSLIPSDSYPRLIPSPTSFPLAGNFVQGSSCFTHQADQQARLRLNRERRPDTAQAQSPAFGPSPKDTPHFLLTAKWTTLNVGGC